MANRSAGLPASGMVPWGHARRPSRRPAAAPAGPAHRRRADEVGAVPPTESGPAAPPPPDRPGAPCGAPPAARCGPGARARTGPAPCRRCDSSFGVGPHSADLMRELAPDPHCADLMRPGRQARTRDRASAAVAGAGDGGDRRADRRWPAPRRPRRRPRGRRWPARRAPRPRRRTSPGSVARQSDSRIVTLRPALDRASCWPATARAAARSVVPCPRRASTPSTTASTGGRPVLRLDDDGVLGERHDAEVVRRAERHRRRGDGVRRQRLAAHRARCGRRAGTPRCGAGPTAAPAAARGRRPNGRPGPRRSPRCWRRCRGRRRPAGTARSSMRPLPRWAVAGPRRATSSTSRPARRRARSRSGRRSPASCRRASPSPRRRRRP